MMEFNYLDFSFRSSEFPYSPQSGKSFLCKTALSFSEIRSVPTFSFYLIYVFTPYFPVGSLPVFRSDFFTCPGS
jgi:hypothetical protein